MNFSQPYAIPVPWLNEKAMSGFLASTVDMVRPVRKLRQVARSTGAQIVPGHDPDAWPKFKHAPEFYR